MIKPNQSVIARLKEVQLVPTGEYEVSGFHEIDAAVASYMSHIFDQARINTLSAENKAFNRFIEAPPSRRVVVGKFDSLVEFLQMLRRSRGRPKSPQVSTDELPVINVSRSFDVVYSTSDQKRDSSAGRGLDIIEDPQTGTPFAALDRSQAALTYTVAALAFEKETLALMLNAVSMHLKFEVHQSFSVNVTVARTSVDLDCTFTDSRDLIWSDMSAPISTDRLYAASITLTVNVDVVRALAVNSVQQRTQIVSETTAVV